METINFIYFPYLVNLTINFSYNTKLNFADSFNFWDIPDTLVYLEFICVSNTFGTFVSETHKNSLAYAINN